MVCSETALGARASCRRAQWARRVRRKAHSSSVHDFPALQRQSTVSRTAESRPRNEANSRHAATVASAPMREEALVAARTEVCLGDAAHPGGAETVGDEAGEVHPPVLRVASFRQNGSSLLLGESVPNRCIHFVADGANRWADPRRDSVWRCRKGRKRVLDNAVDSAAPATVDCGNNVATRTLGEQHEGCAIGGANGEAQAGFACVGRVGGGNGARGLRRSLDHVRAMHLIQPLNGPNASSFRQPPAITGSDIRGRSLQRRAEVEWPRCRERRHSWGRGHLALARAARRVHAQACVHQCARLSARARARCPRPQRPRLRGDRFPTPSITASPHRARPEAGAYRPAVAHRNALLRLVRDGQRRDGGRAGLGVETCR